MRLLKREIDLKEQYQAKRLYSYRRLALLSIHTPPFYAAEGGWSNWTINNHQKYSKKYNYANYIESGKSDIRSPVWSKLSALLNRFEHDKHDWFWVIDIDILIMNGSIKAEDIVDDNYELIMCYDWNWFNAGSFFIRNSEWTKTFLKLVLNVTNPDPPYFEEQSGNPNLI
jgi:hypothetical protein